MSLSADRIALNPIQWLATPDGWIDPSLAPSWEHRAAVIAAAGFSRVHSAPGDVLSPGPWLGQLAAAGITPGPGISGFDWTDDPSERRRMVEESRQLAAAYAALGVDLVFLSANMSETHPRVLHAAIGAEADDARLAVLAEIAQDISAAMTAEGVRPALHPHVGSWIETEHEARFVLDNTDPAALGFGPDTGHLAWTGADPVALVRHYGDRTDGVHLKDHRRDVAERGRAARSDYRTTVMGGLWREPGTGDADIIGLLETLDGLGTTPWIVIEVDSPATATPEESVALCGAWARAALPWS